MSAPRSTVRGLAWFAIAAQVTFTAAVSPAEAAGTVQFSDTVAGTAVPLGEPVAVTGGTATLATTTLGVGSHCRLEGAP